MLRWKKNLTVRSIQIIGLSYQTIIKNDYTNKET